MAPTREKVRETKRAQREQRERNDACYTVHLPATTTPTPHLGFARLQLENKICLMLQIFIVLIRGQRFGRRVIF